MAGVAKAIASAHVRFEIGAHGVQHGVRVFDDGGDLAAADVEGVADRVRMFKYQFNRGNRVANVGVISPLPAVLEHDGAAPMPDVADEGAQDAPNRRWPGFGEVPE